MIELRRIQIAMGAVGNRSKGDLGRGRGLKKKLAIGVGDDAVAGAVEKLNGAVNVLKTAIGTESITAQPFVGINGKLCVE